MAQILGRASKAVAEAVEWHRVSRSCLWSPRERGVIANEDNERTLQARTYRQPLTEDT
jgi:hypothetical protein